MRKNRSYPSNLFYIFERLPKNVIFVFDILGKKIQSFIFWIFFVCLRRTLNTYIYIDLLLSYHLLTTSLYVLVLVFNNIVDLLENFLSRLYGILKQSAQLGL